MSGAMAREATPDEGEGRHVGPLTATMLVVASMIGTGVFTTSGLLIRDLGSPVPVLAAWLLGGVLAACGAVSYGELGAALPRNGGEYQILSRIYHPAVGFAAGLVSLVVGFAAPLATSALAFGHYLSALVPAISPGAAAMVLVAVAAVPHATHAPLGGRLQVMVTLLEIAAVLAFVAAGAARGDPSRLLAGGERPLASIGAPAFAVALVYVSFAYSGWNAAVYLAGEVRDPSRTVPRALLLGTSLVAALYLALNAVFLSAAPPGELAGVVAIGHVAAVRLLGPRAGLALSAIAALVLAAAVRAMLMAGPRVYERMGLDHPRLAVLARRTRRGGPVFAVTLQAALALAMIATSSSVERCDVPAAARTPRVSGRRLEVPDGLGIDHRRRRAACCRRREGCAATRGRPSSASLPAHVVHARARFSSASSRCVRNSDRIVPRRAERSAHTPRTVSAKPLRLKAFPQDGFLGRHSLAEANLNCVASSGVSASSGTYGLVLFVKQADVPAAAKVLGV